MDLIFRQIRIPLLPPHKLQKVGIYSISTEEIESDKREGQPIESSTRKYCLFAGGEKEINDEALLVQIQGIGTDDLRIASETFIQDLGIDLGNVNGQGKTSHT